MTSSRWFWSRVVAALVIPLTVVGVSLALVFMQLCTDGMLRQRETLQHRIRQEECVVRVVNEIINKRLNTQTTEDIRLCDSEEFLPDLRTRFERLDKKLRESGAYR